MQAQPKELVKRYLKSYMRNENFSLEAKEVQDLMATVHALVMKDVRESNRELYEQIGDLATFIDSFKEDICSLFADDMKSSTMDVLDVVLQTTEDAVENILECAEEIDNVAMDAPDELSERLSGVSTRIYEASNFQDLNGQRIIKVVRALNGLEEKINAIMGKVGVDHTDKEKALAAKTEQEKNKSENEALKNGPQSPADAVDQAEIDRLLADL